MRLGMKLLFLEHVSNMQVLWGSVLFLGLSM